MFFKNSLWVGAVVLTGTVFAEDTPQKPSQIDAPVSKIFVPEGFDDNDVIEVVAWGTFPNSCYRLGQRSFEIDESEKSIEVKLSAYLYEGEICLQALTPFIAPIKLNVLKAGSYKVKIASSEVVANFQVDKATTSSPDSFFYAPVSDANLLINQDSGTQEVILRGEYPHMFVGCATMKEVRTYLGPKDVLIVLPILEILEDQDCPANSEHTFEVKQEVTDKLKGEGLMHVRVLNGNSLNKLITTN